MFYFCESDLVIVEMMPSGEGQVLKSLLPFGTDWLMHGALRGRANQEREEFRSWITGLDVPTSHRRVLSELLDMMDEREFVEGRAACVTYEAELARRTGLGESLSGIVNELVSVDLLTCHPASWVFADGRPGEIFRIRRPDVVLTVEAAGPLWLSDSWVRQTKVVTS